MTKSNNILFFLLIFVTIISCSTKKDTFLNRTYNSVTTKFNILYNGNLAFQDGLNEINNKHKDNFYEQLLLEPITFEEEKINVTSLGGPGLGFGEPSEKTNSTAFDKAEEKAVKAIQLHSMKIGGRERNNQIDDAYLLLGKSRYYTQRFVPAIEAFNYVIANYPYASLINETRIWRAKTNIRLNNEKLAIESLKIVLKNEEIPDEVKEQAYTALAIAYVKTDSIQNAIEHLKLATKTHENVEQTARNMFVLGQIYTAESKIDSATMVFNKLIQFKKAPYKFKIYSHLEIAKITTNDSLLKPLITQFKELINDRENRKYLGELYYQAALLEDKRDSLANTITYLRKSLRAENTDDYQKTFAYEKLGDIQFKYANFVLASAYYDSVIKISTDSQEKRIRSIRRKHKSLASLIKFETTLKNNDSILQLVNMPKVSRKLLFEDHIKKLKKADEAKAQLELNRLSFGNSFGGGASFVTNGSKNTWYFYNDQLVSFGKAEFQKKWGNRVLEDDWRLSTKQQLNTNIAKDSVGALVKAVDKYDINTYLDAIPTEKSVIDSLQFYRNEALFETGVIYKERFKNLPLAVKRLERLLSLKPDKNWILPTHYHLYQIYTLLNNKKAIEHKDFVLEEDPTSKYAQIILNNKEEVKEIVLTETDAIYKEIYYLYKENRFQEVVEQITEITPILQESNLIAKFELLKAFAIGKYQSKEAYKQALEFVFINYTNSEEGVKANEILKQLN